MQNSWAEIGQLLMFFENEKEKIGSLDTCDNVYDCFWSVTTKKSKENERLIVFNFLITRNLFIEVEIIIAGNSLSNLKYKIKIELNCMVVKNSTVVM